MKRNKQVHITYSYRLYLANGGTHSAEYKCKNESELARHINEYEVCYSVKSWEIISAQYNYTNA